jgi:hypothetical protein
LAAIRADADPNTFHPLARRDNRPAVVQGLLLGDWVAVSGAAYSTGQGRNTNPLVALFLGLTNVRLGFWWDTGVMATERAGRFPANVWRRIKELPGALFRAQQVLLSEWQGRFFGAAREFWNLADGGHTDNTSVYELVRRRVPFIILTDATHDPDYAYADLGNLVRDVRVDFGVDIEFQDPVPAQLSGPATDWVNLANVGTLRDLQGNPSRGAKGTRHAALARIIYPPESPGLPGTEGWLLVVKTSLDGREPLDVTQYAKSHRDFPQDSTADQVYDDAQWESYRKLGQTAALGVIN